MRLLAEVQRDFTEITFARSDGKEILIQSCFAVTVEQATGKMSAMSANEQMSSPCIAQQRPDPRPVDSDVDGIKAANYFFCNLACLLFTADASCTTAGTERSTP